MARGKQISDDLRETIVQMAKKLNILHIMHYTGHKRRTIERILSDFRRHGTGARQRRGIALRGRKRVLKTGDIRVSIIQVTDAKYLSSFDCLALARKGSV